jgi:hypothetical protein
LGNWLIIQNIDGQIAVKMILLRSNDYLYFAFLGNATKQNTISDLDPPAKFPFAGTMHSVAASQDAFLHPPKSWHIL